MLQLCHLAPAEPKQSKLNELFTSIFTVLQAPRHQLSISNGRKSTMLPSQRCLDYRFDLVTMCAALLEAQVRSFRFQKKQVFFTEV